MIEEFQRSLMAYAGELESFEELLEAPKPLLRLHPDILQGGIWRVKGKVGTVIITLLREAARIYHPDNTAIVYVIPPPNPTYTTKTEDYAVHVEEVMVSLVCATTRWNEEKRRQGASEQALAILRTGLLTPDTTDKDGLWRHIAAAMGRGARRQLSESTSPCLVFLAYHDVFLQEWRNAEYIMEA